jgi:hypothetical protein
MASAEPRLSEGILNSLQDNQSIIVTISSIIVILCFVRLLLPSVYKMVNFLLPSLTKKLFPTDDFQPWLLIALLLIPCLVRISRVGRRRAHYPPGPPTVPVLGNLLQVYRISWVPMCDDTELNLRLRCLAEIYTNGTGLGLRNTDRPLH